VAIHTRYRPEDFARLSAHQRTEVLRQLWHAVFHRGHGPNGGPFTLRDFMQAVGNRLSHQDRAAVQRQAWGQVNDPWTLYVLLVTVAQAAGLKF
jgi:uncharacterized protein (DUF2267 family)